MFSLKYLVIVLQHADVGYRLMHHSKRLKSDTQKLYIEGGQILKIEQHNALYKSGVNASAPKGGMLCWPQVIKGKQDRIDNFPLYGVISDILYQHMQIKSCYDLLVCA